MIWRKLLVAYVVSVFTVLFFACMFSLESTLSPYSAQHFINWTGVVAVYVFPIMCIYGVAVSLVAEIIFRKALKDSSAAAFLLSGLLHIVMGAAGASILIQNLGFGLYGAAAAGLFFVMDWLFRIVEINRRKTIVLTLLAAPVLLFGLLAGLLAASSPPELPFAAQDAVQFATSGSGTIIDLFPKQEGKIQLLIDGYQVERETSVTPLGKETYQVSFIESWSKDGRSGTDRLDYVVTRGTLTASGGTNSPPPYKR